MNSYEVIILFLIIICLILVSYIRFLAKENDDLMHRYIDSTMADMMNKKQTEKGENR